LRNYWTMILAGSLLVAGCDLAPSLNLPQTKTATAKQHAVADFGRAIVKDAGMNGPCQLMVELAAPKAAGFSTQAVIHAWDVTDLFQYEVTLKVFDGESHEYVDLSPAMKVVVPQKGSDNPYNRAVFTNLSQGKKYRAVVVAKGNPGGTAGAVVLNEATPTVADYDFSATQDVEDFLSQSVKVVFDAVGFNGTAHTVIQAPEVGTFLAPSDPVSGTAARLISTDVAINAWGWDIVSTRVEGLDMSPILCSDGKYHVPNAILAEPLDGTMDTSTIHASYCQYFIPEFGRASFQWWMYTGEWAQYGVHSVQVKPAFNDGQGVTGVGPVVGKGTF